MPARRAGLPGESSEWGAFPACAWAGGCGWEEGGPKQRGCRTLRLRLCSDTWSQAVWGPTSGCLEGATEAPVSGGVLAGPGIASSQTRGRLGLPACLSSHVCGGVVFFLTSLFEYNCFTMVC